MSLLTWGLGSTMLITMGLGTTVAPPTYKIPTVWPVLLPKRVVPVTLTVAVRGTLECPQQLTVQAVGRLASQSILHAQTVGQLRVSQRTVIPAIADIKAIVPAITHVIPQALQVKALGSMKVNVVTKYLATGKKSYKRLKLLLTVFDDDES